jgi:hypothetical protein
VGILPTSPIQVPYSLIPSMQIDTCTWALIGHLPPFGYTAY